MNIRKVAIASTIGISMTLTNAHAVLGLVDVEASIGTYMLGGSGSITGKTDDGTADSTMKFDQTMDNIYLTAKIDHFLPIVPNAEIEILRHHLNGTGNTDISFNVFGQEIALHKSSEIDTTYTQADILAYWGVPFLKLVSLGMADLNFGLNLKTISASDNSIFVPIPMYEVDAMVDLPVLPEITAQYKSLFGILNDVKAGVTMELPLPIPVLTLGVEAGYRYQNIDSTAIDNADNAWLKNVSGVFIDWSQIPTTKLEFSGFYFGLNGRF